MLIGKKGVHTSKHAWLQAYRALEHGTCKHRCANKAMIQKFPPGIVDFASVFVELQEKRHAADYDPSASFFRSECHTDLARAAQAIRGFEAESAKDKRAFASYVMLKMRE